MDNGLTKLKIFSFHNSSYDNGKPPMRIHAHNTIEIYYVQEGDVTVTYVPAQGTEPVSFTLFSKQFVLMRPYVQHSINCQNQHLSVYNLELTSDDRSLDLFAYIKTNPYVKRFPAAQNLLYKWTDILVFTDNQNMAHILRLFKQPAIMNMEEPYYYAELEIALKRLFLEILHSSHEGVDITGQNLYIKKIVRYIDSNYTQNISVESIANFIQISVTHLERIFKTHFHRTIKQYINQLRIERIKQLLLATNLPISQIIKTSGYQSIQSFNQNFKKYAGCTPLAYRTAEVQKNIKYRNTTNPPK